VPGGPAPLVELRVLDGPNLYFTRPAVALTLDISGLLDAPDAAAGAFAGAVGLTAGRPGSPRTALRQRFAARAVAHLVRTVAAAAGVTRLAVRSRPTAELDRLVVAYPWRRRGRAEALGEGVADVLAALVAGGASADVGAAVVAAADRVRAADPGPGPTVLRPRVPVVAVTGTNGKTTTSRMIAFVGQVAGRHVGWSNTDGVWIDGEQVEAGDYSGPLGARRVLADPRVDLAVTETARGGILLRGMGTAHNDVSVVTNVSADHLGLRGIDTLDQLAEVKAVVTTVTRATGWAVLNADDPRTLAMRRRTRARPWVFGRDPGSPGIRETLTEGGRATTVLDGQITVLTGADADPLLPVVDVPMTLAGLSSVNVENALAAASAALAVGIARDAVVTGLRTFAPGPEQNPGRMNVYTLPVAGGAVTVVVDLAHNEAGLVALLEVLRGLCPAGSSVRLALGTAGDRTDDILRSLGELAARGADDVVVVHKQRYLRGRTTEELERLYQAGAAAVGHSGELTPYLDELSGLQALVARSGPGDVVAVMCHQDRELIADWLRAEGGRVAGPAQIREQVLAAAPARQRRP
jgi:cyanophycin synthetase